MPLPPDASRSGMPPELLEQLNALIDEAAAAGVTPAEHVLRATGVEAHRRAETYGPVVRWTITDDSSAEWAMRMVARATGEVAAVDAQHDEHAADLADWADRRRRRPAATAAHFAHLLEEYGLEHRHTTGRATLDLPSGKVSTRPVPAGAKIEDPAAVLDWAEHELTGAQIDELAPVKPRVPLVSALTSIEGVRITEAVDAEGGRLLWACGQIGRTVDPGELLDEIETGAPCPDHPEEGADLSANTVLVVVDGGGDPIPGTGVRPGRISATVKPS